MHIKNKRREQRNKRDTEGKKSITGKHAIAIAKEIFYKKYSVLAI